MAGPTVQKILLVSRIGVERKDEFWIKVKNAFNDLESTVRI